MKLTRDQLRAARVLLHLNQNQLADLSMVGVATIRRFEGGQNITPLYLDALRRAVEEAGAILVDGDGERGVGVALRVRRELPTSTRTRMGEAEASIEATGPVDAAPQKRRRNNTSARGNLAKGTAVDEPTTDTAGD